MNPPPSRDSSRPRRRLEDSSGYGRLSGGVTWGDNEGVYSDSDGAEGSTLPPPPAASSRRSTRYRRDSLGSRRLSGEAKRVDDERYSDGVEEYLQDVKKLDNMMSDLDASSKSGKSGSNGNFISSDFIRAAGQIENSSKPVFRASKYSPKEINAAIRNYARFHSIDIEIVKPQMVEDSKLGIDGWANRLSLPSSQYHSSAAGGADDSDSDCDLFDESLFERGSSGQSDY